MPKEDKYYYLKRRETGWKEIHTSQLIRWNPEYIAEVDEEVDYFQYVSLNINKLKQKGIEKPVSTQFDIVKPIIREIFIEHYTLAVKHIYESEMDEGECYIHRPSKDWIIARYFSQNEKQKAKY